MKVNQEEKEMIIFSLNVVLKNYAEKQEDKLRYKDLIKKIEGEQT